MIAPVAAPIPAPPSVPFSRVESGVPEHPAITNKAATASDIVTILCLTVIADSGLLGLLLRFELLNLLLLILDLMLLRIDLRLSLRAGLFAILHRVADHITA